jgi:1-aminocyclopropane-1-carboxylate deaminase/D-cysteine desulfhydrase-like pyridoxal-dependent ACC family enzyme
MNLAHLPRVSLTRRPTPVDDAPRLAEALGVGRALIKRDDLTDLGLGGNKVRKLEFLLGDALSQRADSIITTASDQSNFLRLTAAAARRVGMRPILVVRGRPDAPSRGNLMLMRLFDAEIHYVATEDPYAAATVSLMHELADRERGRGGRPYVVHLATFSAPLAAVAYVAAAAELAVQLHELGARADTVALAVGSATTYSGLLLGFRHLGVQSRVLGASVNTASDSLRSHVRVQMLGASQILGIKTAINESDVDITDEHVGPGYGIPTPESLAAVRLAARTEGLVFDPIYTGKAWAALAGRVRRGDIAPNATVVFLHTGGVPNLFLHDADVGVTAPAASTQAGNDAD